MLVEAARFSALQRAENSSPFLQQPQRVVFRRVSVLFSEPKIPHPRASNYATTRGRSVSVLFSEPKIPHHVTSGITTQNWNAFQCSSASRKFLTVSLTLEIQSVPRFQCSSASRKFLTPICVITPVRANVFQCSSASRKFLTERLNRRLPLATPRFSALQRAENSSPCVSLPNACVVRNVSVLFSEPKIPHPCLQGRRQLSL